MKYHGDVVKEYLRKNFQIAVDIDEYGWEGVLLYHEEIEEDIIPCNYLKRLIDPVLFHMTTYDDDQGNEWLFSVATHPDDVFHLFYITCYKNNDLFTGWVPEE